MLKGITLEDKISVPSQRVITDSGQMIVPCAFARTGTQIYTAKSLSMKDEDPDKLIEVIRREEDVFDKESIKSFRSVPVTIGHPKDNGVSIKVTAENAKDLQVGMLEGLPTRDEDLLTGTLVITRQDAIDSIEGGTKELSAGYTCDIMEQDGKYYQVNIRANHIAIVPKGRAGSDCSIADEADSTDVTTDDYETEYSEADLSEAAEALANAEEEEAVEAGKEAQWAAHYAVSTMAMYAAHKEVAKAARKYSDKMHKIVSEGGNKELNDEEEVITSNLTDDVNTLVIALEDSESTINDLKEKLKAAEVKLSDNINDAVTKRCDIIFKASEVLDEDISLLTDMEIKKKAVSKFFGINLNDRSEAYIDARFDLMSEGYTVTETPLGKMLRDQVVVDAQPVRTVSLAEQARQNMINRNLGKGK